MITFLPSLNNLSFDSLSPASMGSFQTPVTREMSGQSASSPIPADAAVPGQSEASSIPADAAHVPGRSPIAGTDNQAKIPGKPDNDTYECETCKNRRYQDGSNDPGVSFKTPTRLSPERAAFAIRAHEAEHVAHARVKALKEDQEIVSQSVSYRTGVCPECGRVYMAGGTTRTTFRSAPVVEEKPVEKGRYVDVSV